VTSRERVKAIIARRPADRTGFWLGNPHQETWPIYLDHFNASTEEEVRRKLGDDFRWISPQFFADAYRHPDGHKMFDDTTWERAEGPRHPLAEIEKVEDLDGACHWPEAKRLNFDSCLRALENAGPYYRASGFWTCFYHNVMDLLGMEKYMMDMYLNPGLVHAVTDRVCTFYYEANEMFFAAAGDLVDGFFFGNDFGTQQDLICGPEQFDEYIMSWFRKFTEQGHRWGKQVILHSCGAVHKVIDALIESGVDCLHPLQALAKDMDAETLARDFGGRIAFLGGIDVQQLMVRGSPDDVRREVGRVRGLLGPNLIVSPSHEALLPNVPPENALAMAEAATRD
jgi:uroporphyrinogen decarboxylase